MKRRGRISGNTPYLRPPRILVAGGDAAGIEAIRACLCARGFRPVFAASALRAVSMARSERPNAVVLEFPAQAALRDRVLEAIREVPDLDRIPAIAITPPTCDPEPVWRTGFDLVVSRPLAPETLVAALERLLFGSRAQPMYSSEAGVVRY